MRPIESAVHPTATEDPFARRLAAARPALLAALLGAAILFGAGLAQPQALHDAAHDARHAFAFPCH